MSVSIVIADDHPVLREGLRAILDAELDMDVVAEASDGREALHLVEELNPDVLVLDLSMPALPGLEVLRRVAGDSPETKVVVLSMHAHEAYAERAFSDGASGYVVKEAGIEDVKKAIRAAVDGRPYVSPPLSEAAIEDYAATLDPGRLDSYETLTDRERDVLHLVSDGLSNQEISSRLSISRRTVEAHRAKLMLKLRIKSHSELLRYVIRRERFQQSL